MESDVAVEMLACLAHEGRLALFRLLVRRAPDDVAAGELAAALDLRATTLSNQLAQLERARLVRSRRDGRSVFYRADISRAGALIGFLADDCCKGRPEACGHAVLRPLGAHGREEDAMNATGVNDNGVYNVLFLCTHNSARSIFGEVIVNRLGQGRFRGFSAGSAPRSEVHPQAAELLKGLNFETGELRPKDWSEFAKPDAPELHFVFTVCDNAANEVCPTWPGQPMSAHWGVDDPSAATGTETERAFAFTEAYRSLYNRIAAFTSLPIASLDKLALQKQLDDIGRMKAPADEPAA